MDSWEHLDLVAIYCGDDPAGWVLPAWVVPVEYGLIAAAAAWVLLVRRRPALYPKLT